MGEPAEAGGFAVNVAGLARGGFDLALRAVDAVALGSFAFGAFDFDGFVCGADLNAGIEGVIDLHFEFEFEVAVLFVGGEEGVGAAFRGGADDGAVHHLVGSGAVALGPAFEGFAVKETGPAVLSEGGRGREQEGGKQMLFHGLGWE